MHDEMPGSRPARHAALQDLDEALRRLIADRPPARDFLHALAQYLATLADAPVPAQSPAAPAETQPAERPAPPPPLPELPRRPATLRLGGAETVIPVTGTDEEVARAERARAPAPVAAPPMAPEEPPPDLQWVVRRARLKAECCRWAVTRRRRVTENAPFETAIKPNDDELVRQSRQLPDCRVWPLDPYVQIPDDEKLESLALAYENLASICELVIQIRGQSEALDERWLQPAYELLAESQSALRVALEEQGLPRDLDQDAAFFWLKRRTKEDAIFIAQYMKLDHRADPEAGEDREHRISELNAGYQEDRQKTRDRRNLKNKIRYLCGRLVADPDSPDAPAHWQTLFETIQKLLDTGVPASDAEVREQLEPVIDLVPENLRAEDPVEVVFASVDQFVAQRETGREAPPGVAADSEYVRRARELVRGRVLLFIGGERRIETQRAMERALELEELRWISTRAHQSTADFEAQVARPEVAAVLLKIHLGSHSYGPAFREMCRRYEKPFVRLVAGHGVNRVAMDIVAQASEQLRSPPPVANP